MGGLFADSASGGEILDWSEEIAKLGERDRERPGSPPLILGPAWPGWLSPEDQADDDL